MKNEVSIKIVKIAICLLLSAFLVIGVVTVPFYYSITGLMEPETVALVIKEVDYKRVVRESPDIKKALDYYGVTPTEADTFMKSKQTGEMVEIYADEVTEIFLEIPDDRMLDVPYIKEIVAQNTDKFLDIAEKNLELRLKREVIKKNVDTFLDKNEVVIEDAIPVIEEIKDVVKTIHTSRVVENTLSFWFALLLVAVAFILIAVIIVLMRSSGFLWVGIDFAVISIILTLVIAFSKSHFVSVLALELSNFGTQIIESAVSISTEKIIIAVFGTIIMAVLFFGFFAVLKLLKKKYQNEVKIQVSDL